MIKEQISCCCCEVNDSFSELGKALEETKAGQIIIKIANRLAWLLNKI